MIVDAHGYPVEFIISNGTTSDVKVAPDLISLVNLSHTDCVIADKIRHLVENTFATLKHYRGIATRFDKLKQSFENNLALACAYLWLKL